MAKKRLGKLESVDVKAYWEHEAAEFTPWLAREENLELLSATLGMELELEGFEVAVGPYKADLVLNDASASGKVIVENQLGKTNHDHVGKTLTYASGLDADTIVWIAREFSDEHRKAVDYLNQHANPSLRFPSQESQLHFDELLDNRRGLRTDRSFLPKQSSCVYGHL